MKTTGKKSFFVAKDGINRYMIQCTRCCSRCAVSTNCYIFFSSSNFPLDSCFASNLLCRNTKPVYLLFLFMVKTPELYSPPSWVSRLYTLPPSQPFIHQVLMVLHSSCLCFFTWEKVFVLSFVWGICMFKICITFAWFSPLPGFPLATPNPKQTTSSQRLFCQGGWHYTWECFVSYIP